MTERGLPIVDGAPACPFVAFDDDRDERAASPDHRHRCYAEQVPAPRALAHQEAYCLSSAFPVCPTFQDWARRESARSRMDPPQSTDSVGALAAAPQPPRNPPRNWAAPPPWVPGSRPARGQELLWNEDSDQAYDRDDVGGVPGGRGLSGSYADRVASQSGASAATAGAGADDEADEGQADDDRGDLDVRDGDSGGAPMNPPVVPAAAASGHGDVGAWDDEPSDEPADPQLRRRRERDPGRVAAFSGNGGGGGNRNGGGNGGNGGSGGNGGNGGRAGNERPRRDTRAPDWERARPLEAYPTLRSRRLSEISLPPVLVGVVALAIAAAVLFALPGLLGFGNPSTGGGSPTPTLPVQTQLITPAPTPVPQPTELLYTVQAGDTMSRIAGRFGIPIGDLIAANAETIPDPNRLQIGDQVIIPARAPEEVPAASEIPGAS